MATDKMTTENLKVFEEKEKRGLPIWAWLLPLFILLMIGIWLYSRHSNTRTAAEATPVTDQTKPDNGAAATQAGSALTAAGIADSIRTNGRVSLNNSDVHFATGSATLAGVAAAGIADPAVLTCAAFVLKWQGSIKGVAGYGTHGC